MLIDPEAYDASEQQFAASLETPPRPRFVVEETHESGLPSVRNQLLSITEAEEGSDLNIRDTAEATLGVVAEAEEAAVSPVVAEILPELDADSWRQEVAARVNNYRARRRPREPRYPSLRLKFEASEATASPLATRQAIAVESACAAVERSEPITHPAGKEMAAAETSAKIIEFPRSAAAPPAPLDELAEPVLERPRILEAVELVPPPPSMGGILIEPMEERAEEKRPGFEMPLQPAPMARRLIATAIDAVLVLLAFTAFAYIFFRITVVVPPLQHAAAIALLLTGLFWSAYQYLMLVYAGTTPGLKLAKLQLNRFDGNPVPRRIRRWRVLVSVLSGVSLGLGYAWCFFDEDELCWHDRITRTYMAPKS